MTANRPIDHPSRDDHELTLEALCEAAGVTVRTVRYYISEGLLPPPEGHGVQARYTRQHLDRLHVIASLKEQYLPLREIRRSLDAMTPREITEAAALDRTHAPAAEAIAPPPSKRLGLRMEHDAESRPERREMRAPRYQADAPSSAADYIAETLGRSAPARPQRRSSSLPEPDAQTTWKRIPITANAELLIEEQVWNRRREQLESLVSWARKVLNGS